MLWVNGQTPEAGSLSKPQMTLAPETAVLCLWDLIGAKADQDYGVTAFASWAGDGDGYHFSSTSYEMRQCIKHFLIKGHLI